MCPMSSMVAGSVVIGAGVVGCAVARELAQAGHEPLILEAGPRIAEGTTSRNSGVVHAGIYYPPMSLKARLCVDGKNLLQEYLAKNESKFSIGYRKCGKWIVASKEEEVELGETFENAKASGATGLSIQNFDGEKVGIPQVKGTLAIYSADTGIVDPYELSRAFLLDAESAGSLLLVDCKVDAIERQANSNFTLNTSKGPIETSLVINCAGLFSDEIAAMVGCTQFPIYAWRGDYFKLSSRFRLPTLIYPVKKRDAAGLGVHLTLNLDGSNKIGPDVEYTGLKSDFSPREGKQQAFFEAASKYLVGLHYDDLTYDMVGIRPKLRAPDERAEKDFVIHKSHSNFVHLLGIESPGLTASLALAKKTLALL